jgi:hypothetical protein
LINAVSASNNLLRTNNAITLKKISKMENKFKGKTEPGVGKGNFDK